MTPEEIAKDYWCEYTDKDLELLNKVRTETIKACAEIAYKYSVKAANEIFELK